MEIFKQYMILLSEKAVLPLHTLQHHMILKNKQCANTVSYLPLSIAETVISCLDSPSNKEEITSLGAGVPPDKNCLS